MNVGPKDNAKDIVRTIRNCDMVGSISCGHVLGFGFANGAAFVTEISCASAGRPSSKSTNYRQAFVQNKQTDRLGLSEYGGAVPVAQQ
jgi:hypothetical protein